MAADPMVRRVEPGDEALLKRVRLAALADAPSAFGRTYGETIAYPDQYWTDAAVERSAGPDAAMFFSFLGDDVTGLVGGWRQQPDRSVIELVSMWVDPYHRGTGTAAALVDVVIDWATGNGDEVVLLWVTEGNDRAIEFYRRCGFLETGEAQSLPSDRNKDELRMHRSLAQHR